MKVREAFNFYRSYYEVLKDIRRDEDKLTYLLALLERQFNGTEPELEDIPRLVYNSQKHSIDKQVKGWEDKTKTSLTHPTEDPYLPPTQHPTEHPSLQEQGQGEGEGKVEEKVEVEVEGGATDRKPTLVFHQFVKNDNPDDLELFTYMFAEFNEKDSEFDGLYDLWIKLPSREQEDSVKFASNYIKYCVEKKKKISLYYYLSDKKYNWDTIRK